MAEKSKRTKAQGTKVEVSKTASTDYDDKALVFVDLNTTTKQVQWQGGQSAEIDATTFASDEKETELGLADPGEFSVEGNYAPEDDGQTLLFDAHSTKEKHVFRVTFANGWQFLFVGMVRQFSWGAQVDGLVTSNYSVRVSGKPKRVPPVPAG
ncbi:tail protein [Burkholderia contaminans FFH2055]|uniref:phage tail tube protein n=1 Tax=Burkholderia cepacia complex TaxID=87882 RepID=UPI000626A1F7|nr:MULTISPECIES: phage tail tube protein [Burkholderia cepacia complex]KKL33988.1 tail protein [Burkholderia contaminans FFH2055]MCA8213727.1 phage tail protein [Burkholderia cepacia]MEB4632172.1 phage tail tube protein [Burkholderia contaminans]MEB4639679.1 phage tail tube protein [Burkholderia contaminans]MEB4654335.1 phage tail tube protein [Burkholderia contaminans]